MKGDVAVETLGVIVAIAATITLFFIIFPRMIESMWKEIALYSPSVVSRELAGLITISGAAPHSISISYYPSNLPYNVKIKNRAVSVSLSEKAEGILEKTPAMSTIPIDPEASFADVNYFETRKWPEVRQIKTEETCEGTATPCRFLDRKDCEKQQGCHWFSGGAKERIDECIGAAKPCSSFTPQTCTSQIGCYVSEKFVSVKEVKYGVEAKWIERVG
ncbi:MAG: hypothetical protein QMD12_02720 [Candidatus Aenigmarchaeota archaeon]|nr:hypothetical protein [Candidatus Aenigmarchaeota archaeon]